MSGRPGRRVPAQQQRLQFNVCWCLRCCSAVPTRSEADERGRTQSAAEFSTTTQSKRPHPKLYISSHRRTCFPSAPLSRSCVCQGIISFNYVGLAESERKTSCFPVYLLLITSCSSYPLADQLHP